jgi:hypothetical protein
VDTSYDGFGNMTFVPAFRLTYHASDTWAISAETYSDFGPFSEFHKASDQAHQLYGDVDYTGKLLEFQAGVGFGLTDASDKLTFKTILSFDLNRKR